MEFSDLPWDELRALRALYLSERPLPKNYWTSAGLLALYDRSLGERIGWKWSAVLDELRARGWRLEPGAQAIDWGCGSGIAAHRFVTHEIGAELKALALYDRSPDAERHSLAKVQMVAPAIALSTGLSTEPRDVYLLSHIVTELEGGVLRGLKDIMLRSGSFIWVEPGTQAVGRSLPAIRDEFIRHGWEPMGPCPHGKRPCGVLRAGNERHWCHNFAVTPNEVHHDPFWAAVRDELEIDIRRTPYTFMAMRNPAWAGRGWKLEAPEAPSSTGELVRILGEARHYKGFSKPLLCRLDPSGAPDRGQGEVAEFTLQKRDAPELLKSLKKRETSPLLRVTIGPQGKITQEPSS